MRKLVYEAKELFAEIERRLESGERIISYECELPDCTPNKGKIYFYKQGEGFVVGVCDLNNKKTVTYNGDNRDLKYLVSHQAILYDNMPQIFNMFYRMDAIYSSTDTKLVYYVDGYGYYEDGKYEFEIKKAGGYWRAYILRTPSYGGRDESLAATHRLRDGTRLYVCVVQNIDTKERMIAVAKKWAICEQNYIKTGERF